MRGASWPLIFSLIAGCAHGPAGRELPVRPPAPEDVKPDIERGAPVPPLDYLASFLAFPIKLLLWNRHYATHRISPETEAVLADFVRRNDLGEVKVRLNQCAPFQEVGRIFRNHEMGWPYRILAVPFTFITAATGRLLAGILFSDYFDPFSNTIHVFSDDAAIALHEGGHAKDFKKQHWKGTYALVRSFPGVDLAQEMIATQEALEYLEFHGTDEQRIRAPKVLYPAFGTYAGGYLTIVPFAWIGALAGGHVYGRLRSKYVREEIATRKPPVKESIPSPS
ncbi:MAG: hypothetical protein HY714_06130 [Candidatus Omnitrophica bacterium]|nr:hypothetical protein [Candidatus Omnitrophota bacterium]